jgi:hypothetical protein
MYILLQISINNDILRLKNCFISLLPSRFLDQSEWSPAFASSANQSKRRTARPFSLCDWNWMKKEAAKRELKD